MFVVVNSFRIVVFRYTIKRVLFLRIFSKNRQSFLCFWTTPTTQVVVILSTFNQDSNNISDLPNIS
ncbi:hypothetical protein HanIR_Chr09g0406201 [Helianthus annuus]|nr:hypothetical protein HanIR_Chr09g0406201 [Helianthus annuus]